MKEDYTSEDLIALIERSLDNFSNKAYDIKPSPGFLDSFLPNFSGLASDPGIR